MRSTGSPKVSIWTEGLRISRTHTCESKVGLLERCAGADNGMLVPINDILSRQHEPIYTHEGSRENNLPDYALAQA